jgi:hypothetical protein
MKSSKQEVAGQFHDAPMRAGLVLGADSYEKTADTRTWPNTGTMAWSGDNEDGRAAS